MSDDGIINVAPAAATAVLGYNMLQTEPDLAISNKKRTITHVGLAGSAAINDAILELRIGGMYAATLRNTTAGAVIVQPDDDLIPCNIEVPANQEITARVTDPATTNPLNLVMVIKKG